MMLRRLTGSLRWKLLAASASIAVIMLMLLLANTGRLLDRMIEEQGRVRVSEISQLLNEALAPLLFRRDFGNAEGRLKNLVESADGSIEYLVMFDQSGQYFAHAGPVKPGVLPKADAAPISTSHSFHGALTLRMGQVRVGELRYGLSFADLFRTRQNVMVTGTVVGAGAIVVTIIAFTLIGFLLTRDLQRLVEATRAVSAGDYFSNVRITTGGEIGDLAEHFNAMLEKLRNTIAELKERSDRFQSLSTLTADWFWEQDEHFRFKNPADVGSNPDWHARSPLGKTRWELESSNLTEAQWAEHRAVLERHEPFSDFEFSRISNDGRLRWISSSGGPIFDENGRFRGYRGVGKDITERKQAENDIRELNVGLEQHVAERTAELAAVNRELETFTYSVSHDLKAPLRGIDGYSRLLLENYSDKLDDEGQRFLKNVRNGVRSMSELIEDLLTYSRIERGESAAELVDIKALAEALIVECRADPSGGDYLIVNTVPDLRIMADREGLTLALRNLLGNAVKFSKGTPDARVEAGGRDDGASCTLWVRDNGPGFDMKYHDRIFGIFERLHRAEEYPGTGVGLAIVQKAMARMGGRVWADSIPGQGATFYLEIPRRG